jgi:CheY-like chemotaxis protein
MTRLVLLAEDNPDHALITTEALESAHGYDVRIEAVEDGEAALSFLDDPRQPLPNLILLDIQMPRLDGFETLKRIKRDPVLQVIPVVMLTSSNDERDVARSYGLGSNSFVTKPVGTNELHERLAQIPSYWFGVNTPPVEVAAR